MRTPNRLQPLMDAHLIDDVLGQLKSGKEAEVFVVSSRGEVRCAKVYKEANNRSFKQASQYTEGRQARGSRQNRAMNKKSKFGREQMEAEWQNTEVEALAMLATNGVRVPKIHEFYEGVLLLEMIVDKQGQPAPRLNDVSLTKDEALNFHYFLVHQAALMLLAGYVHGDLSEFNVLLSQNGPVIIDLPQAVLSTANNASKLFKRDVDQLRNYFARFAPELQRTAYSHEIWDLFEKGKLKSDTKLTGIFKHDTRQADVRGVLNEIDAANEEEMKRRQFQQKK